MEIERAALQRSAQGPSELVGKAPAGLTWKLQSQSSYPGLLDSTAGEDFFKLREAYVGGTVRGA